MIDFIILEQMTAFAVIMQKHPGWVGKSLHLLDFEPYSFVFLAIYLSKVTLMLDFSAIGFIQKTIVESLGCIWFNRTEAKDREIVARK